MRSWLAMTAMIAALMCSFPSIAAKLTVNVQNSDGKPLIGAVITAVRKDAADKPAAPVEAAMAQVDLSFQPDLIVIPVGSNVDFPNNDKVSHQIYSFSEAKRFQLPLYRGKPYPPQRFEKAGLVTLGCNIHDAMLAYIFVTDAPYFGRSDSSGTWSAATVPAGHYHVLIWHPRLRDAPAALERDVEVVNSDTTLDVRLSKPLRPAPLLDRPHTWDTY